MLVTKVNDRCLMYAASAQKGYTTARWKMFHFSKLQIHHLGSLYILCNVTVRWVKFTNLGQSFNYFQRNIYIHIDFIMVLFFTKQICIYTSSLSAVISPFLSSSSSLLSSVSLSCLLSIFTDFPFLLLSCTKLSKD